MRQKREINPRIKWLTAAEAARLTGLSRKTIWLWGMSGFVPVKANDFKKGKYLYRREDIEKRMRMI